ncbi:acyltransferase [Aquimarina sp. 2201CG5-10]|uniref:acyltransferase family protein n=1 Tax=Aquimarina callyspongiae TaxID=3098150 RepID=UPI002AB4D8B0|nr:acyltransferase [Aquimarina sp. 2201CG5-10]MDY8138352.1 acyltransferase [Aquimarina sp. 2201CG5-10]
MKNNSIAYIYSLTPLRGIAAILVFFHHYDNTIGQLLPNGNYLVTKWYLMVDFFFLLSGFIMYHVYGDVFRNSIRKKDIIEFFKARFARLYPLHFFTLMFLIGMFALLNFKLPASDIPPVLNVLFDPNTIISNLLLIQAWGMHIETSWNIPSWSISVEWFLYMVFPFLLFFLTRYKKVAKWLIAIIAILGLTSIMYYFQPYTWAIRNQHFNIPDINVPQNSINVVTGIALLRGLCTFTVGMVLYEAFQSKWLIKYLSKGYISLLVWSFLFVVWIGDWLPDVLAIPFFCILLLNTAYSQGTIKRLLNNKVFNYLGEISYSIYMVHMPLMLSFYIVILILGVEAHPAHESTDFLNNFIGSIIGLLLVIGLASLTYRYIEKPFRKYLKGKLSGNRSYQHIKN